MILSVDEELHDGPDYPRESESTFSKGPAGMQYKFDAFKTIDSDRADLVAGVAS